MMFIDFRIEGGRVLLKVDQLKAVQESVQPDGTQTMIITLLDGTTYSSLGTIQYLLMRLKNACLMA